MNNSKSPPHGLRASEGALLITTQLRDMARAFPLTCAVGDIHGCFEAARMVVSMLETLDCNVVFLGDYIDRGPSSLQTLELLSKACQHHDDWIFLMGNHEDMLVKMLKLGIEESIARYDLENAPKPCLLEFRENGGCLEVLWPFFSKLCRYHETRSFLYVHAGISAETIPLERQDLLVLTKSGFTNRRWNNKRLVHGHVVVEEPVDDDTHINLDTGCFRNGWLTVGCLNDESETLEGWFQIAADCSAFRLHLRDQERT